MNDVIHIIHDVETVKTFTKLPYKTFHMYLTIFLHLETVTKHTKMRYNVTYKHILHFRVW